MKKITPINHSSYDNNTIKSSTLKSFFSIFSFIFGVIVALNPANSHSQVITAFNYNGSATADSFGPYMLGVNFTVGSSALEVNSLGVQDIAGDGFIASSIQVGIWSQDGLVLLGSGNVASSDTLVGTYRYTSLSSSVTLSANTTYLIGAVVGNGIESYGDTSGSYSGNTPYVTYNYSTWANGGNTFAAPINNIGANGRLAPVNFQAIVVVPEPRTVVLFLLAGCMMMLVLARRQVNAVVGNM